MTARDSALWAAGLLITITSLVIGAWLQVDPWAWLLGWTGGVGTVIARANR